MLTATRRFIHRISPRCSEATRVISQSADTKPALLDRIGLAIHLLLCTPCRKFKKSVQILHHAMQRLTTTQEDPATITLSPDAKLRIRTALQSTSPDSASN